MHYIFVKLLRIQCRRKWRSRRRRKKRIMLQKNLEYSGIPQMKSCASFCCQVIHLVMKSPWHC